MYKELERKFKVIYPESENATYTSLLNYSDDLHRPRQRWYRYKEGFSLELVRKLIEEYNKNPDGVILDPFLGSGSTLVSANQLGYKGIGFEVNPFSFFLSSAKLSNYSDKIINEFKQAIVEVLKMNNKIRYTLPTLSISGNVFSEEVEVYMMTVKENIDQSVYSKKVKELLLLGWLSSIEPLSNYRKAGNGLKKRNYVKPRIITVDDAKKEINTFYQAILEDISDNSVNFDVEIYSQSSLNLDKFVSKDSVSGIIFSPPYANSFDYTEIYKLELWFGEFVKSYEDLKVLRSQSLRSHLNGLLKEQDADTSILPGYLNSLLAELRTKKLWNKRIPTMLELYYLDMFEVIKKSYNALEKDGFCSIVVGNSSYGGIVFPTDLILADYAEAIGFKVDKIEVDRFIITSSQQYEMTKENGRYLRESVICLVKN